MIFRYSKQVGSCRFPFPKTMLGILYQTMFIYVVIYFVFDNAL